MQPLNILVCGGDGPALERFAEKFNDEGIRVATSTQLVDALAHTDHEWDFLLVDLDGLSGYLRTVLPGVYRQFPNLSILAVSTESGAKIPALAQSYGLEFDGYLTEIPRPEDLIVSFPHVAAKYLSETGPLGTPGVPPWPRPDFSG